MDELLVITEGTFRRSKNVARSTMLFASAPDGLRASMGQVRGLPPPDLLSSLEERCTRLQDAKTKCTQAPTFVGRGAGVGEAAWASQGGPGKVTAEQRGSSKRECRPQRGLGPSQPQGQENGVSAGGGRKGSLEMVQWGPLDMR